jgi:hypothetical protein
VGEIKSNENQAVIDVMKDMAHVEYFEVQRGDAAATSLVAVPTGKRLRSIKSYLDEYLPNPERKRGQAVLTTLAAFNAYTNHHKRPESVVFLNDAGDAPVLYTVFNAHEPTASGKAGWQDHFARYEFPLSEEWEAWSNLADWMTQHDLAVFLEERITDVLDPTVFKGGEKVVLFAQQLGLDLASPAKLLELSRGLAVTVNASCGESGNLSTGERSLTYREEHKDASGQQLKVPGAFCIQIPVFKLGPVYRIPVRLRYKVSGGRVQWQLAPHRMDAVREDAIAEAALEVANKTDLTVFRGSSEGAQQAVAPKE